MRNGTVLLNHYTRKEREGGGCVACGAGLKREMNTRGEGGGAGEERTESHWQRNNKNTLLLASKKILLR